MNGAELFVKTLQRHGIDWIATLCGHGLDPLFRAARDAGMRLVDTRNEQTASYIADAYGRLTRRPGVCAVSSGVAHVNALTGVANAWFDRGPMLLVSGAAASTTAGQGHFQDMDQVAIAQPLCKLARVVRRPEEMGPLLEEAIYTAVAEPCGPVHLTIPMDMQTAEVEPGAAHSEGIQHPTAADEDIEGTATAINGSMTPLVIAGSGVFYSQTGADMLAFCEQFRIPVMTPIWDRGSVEFPSPVFAGILGAATGEPAILDGADCILLAGAESDYRVGYLRPPATRPEARILSVGHNWSALQEACRRLDLKARSEWLARCIERRDEFRAQVELRGQEQAQVGLHAIHIIRAIEKAAALNPVLLIDGGSIGQWAHQLLCSNRYSGDWLTCGRSGVVGWGVGGGMGARLAFPDRPVILLSGDGAFTFNIADLESAVRQRLGFVAVVADDQAWGITRTGHIRQFGESISSTLGFIAFDEAARAFGARGVRATTPDEVEGHLRRALEDTSVTVIHVPITGGNP